jgi:hypothetical protein
MKKKDLFFTAKAMQPFSRIILSCPPTYPREAGLKHEKIIVELAGKKRPVSVRKIENMLDEKLFIYQDISNYAHRLKKKLIDEHVVLGYFGGKRHIDKVLNEIRLSPMDIPEEGAYIFQHILKVVKFSWENGMLNCVYKNGKDNAIRINDLQLPQKEMRLVKDGDKGLVHFSIVVSRSVDPRIERKLKAEQKSHPVFKKAIKNLNNETLDSVGQCRLAKEALRRHFL